jgi:hypothetical protein
VFMFRRGGVTRTRDLGRVGTGLRLILIALQHLLSMITPYEDVPSLRMLLGAVDRPPDRHSARGGIDLGGGALERPLRTHLTERGGTEWPRRSPRRGGHVSRTGSPAPCPQGTAIDAMLM